MRANFRKFYAFGWYGDIAATGERVILFPREGVLRTDRLTVPCPPNTGLGIIQPRLTTVFGFRFAGPSHEQKSPTSTRIWEWRDNTRQWQIAADDSYVCPSPVLYNGLGELEIATVADGANGLRFCERDGSRDGRGRIFTGDQTYGYAELSEYTLLGRDPQTGREIRIGQGHPDWARDALWVFDGVDYRQLEPGRCTFIRGDSFGDDISILAVKPERTADEPEGTVTFEGTFADLRALPLVRWPKPTKPKDPDPTDPEPPVFTPIRLPDEAQAIVTALYLRHKDLAHGDDDQRRALTKKIAEQVRFTLGAAWGWKQAGGPPSKDSIAKRDGATLHGFDLFNGSTREPNDHPMSVDISAQTFIVVEPVNHLGQTPTKPADPPPPGPDLTPRVVALEQTVQRQQREIDQLRADLGKAWDATVAGELIQQRVIEALANALELYEARGNTSRTLAHGHTVKLPIVRKEK